MLFFDSIYFPGIRKWFRIQCFLVLFLHSISLLSPSLHAFLSTLNFSTTVKINILFSIHWILNFLRRVDISKCMLFGCLFSVSDCWCCCCFSLFSNIFGVLHQMGLLWIRMLVGWRFYRIPLSRTHACLLDCSDCLLTCTWISFYSFFCPFPSLSLFAVFNEVHLKISPLIPISGEGYYFFPFELFHGTSNIPYERIISIIGMLLSYMHKHISIWHWSGEFRFLLPQSILLLLFFQYYFLH